MATTIIIIVFSWFIYKCGLVGLWLDLFRLEEYHTQPATPGPTPPPHQEPPAPAKQEKKIDLERMQLEKIAGNIITYQGYKKDAFKLVKGFDNETLTEIITTFRNDLDL